MLDARVTMINQEPLIPKHEYFNIVSSQFQETSNLLIYYLIILKNNVHY